MVRVRQDKSSTRARAKSKEHGHCPLFTLWMLSVRVQACERLRGLPPSLSRAAIEALPPAHARYTANELVSAGASVSACAFNVSKMGTLCLRHTILSTPTVLLTNNVKHKLPWRCISIPLNPYSLTPYPFIVCARRIPGAFVPLLRLHGLFLPSIPGSSLSVFRARAFLLSPGAPRVGTAARCGAQGCSDYRKR
jgi:hypothetical protein